MTEIRNTKKHVDGIEVEIFDDQPDSDRIPIPDSSSDSESSKSDDEEKVDPSKKEQDSIHKTCVQNMKYVLNKPDCFEKTLIRIIYLMSWLSKDREGEKFLLETTKPALELLQDDLGKILGQMARENIEDSLTELLINQTVRLFKTNEPQEQLHSLMTKLQENIRPFNFEDFFELVEQCETNSRNLEKQNIILLLGTTGAGKSTLIQYLFGATMVKFKNGHIEAHPMPDEIKSFLASAQMRSCTRFINCIQIVYKDKRFIIVDTPGFGDTQGAEVDISNTIGIIRSVSKANKVFPVILFNNQNTGGRAELLKSQIQFYSNMINNIQTHLPQMNFFFTKFSEEEQIPPFIESIKSDLSSQELTRPLLKDVLTHMVDKRGGELLKLYPLKKENRDKVLDLITTKEGILNPKNVFKISILENSRHSLDRQVGLHEKHIMDLVSRPKIETVEESDVSVALDKYQQMAKLAEIFERHENTYKERLKKHGEAIIKKIQERISTQNNVIEKSLKSGNQLDLNDIQEFKKIIEFEQILKPLINLIGNQLIKKEGSGEQKYVSPSEFVRDQCQKIINDLETNHHVNSDKWIEFIVKAISLSGQINVFTSIKELALQIFKAKFELQAKKAKENIDTVEIIHYSQDNFFQSQKTRDEMKRSPPSTLINEEIKQQTLPKKKFIEVGDTSESEFEMTEVKKGPADAQPIQIKLTLEPKIDMLFVGKKICENMKRQSQKKHNLFRQAAIIMMQGLQKIKSIENKEKDYFSSLQKISRSVKIVHLEEKIKKHFFFEIDQENNTYNFLDDFQIMKIQQSLTMIENYFIVCRDIDLQYEIEAARINQEYQKRCLDLFQFHYKFLIGKFQMTQVSSSFSADEIKKRFDQIKMLLKITQIQQSTKSLYQNLTFYLQNNISFYKNEIISIIQQFNEYSSVEQEKSTIKSLDNLFKRLKEALTFMTMLSKLDLQNAEYMIKINESILESFKYLIQKLESDVSQFLSLTIENYLNLKPVCIVYCQIKQLYDCAQIIDKDDKKYLRQNVGRDWIQKIMNTIKNIQTTLNTNLLNQQLMHLSDYRKYHFSTEYLKQLSEGSIPQYVNQVLDDIEKYQEKINPGAILQELNQKIPIQLKLQEQAFIKILATLNEQTEVMKNKIIEESKEEDFILEESLSQNVAQIKITTDQVFNMFKLAQDLKSRYPQILKYILKSEEREGDEDYLLNYYTKQLIKEFFDALSNRHDNLRLQGRQWLYLKLQAMKQLKEIQLYPKNQLAQEIYTSLENYYYFNLGIELKKAKESFLIGQYNEVAEQLKEFSNNENQNTKSIKEGIIKYINAESRNLHDMIEKKMSPDFNTKKDDIREIINYSAILMKIQAHLNEYIIINQKDIKSFIKTEVLGFFQKCFSKTSSKIDKLISTLNFSEGQDKIKEFKSQFQNINQGAGADIRDLEEYKNLCQLQHDIISKKIVLKEAIQNSLNLFVQRDIQNAMIYPTANTLYWNISKMLEHDHDQSIQIMLDEFCTKIISKYTAEKDKKLLSLDQTESPEQNYKRFEEMIIQLKSSLVYMPTIVNQQLTNLLDSWLDFQKQQRDEKLIQQRQVIDNGIRDVQNVQQLGVFLAQNYRSLNIRQVETVKSNLRKDHEDIINQAQDYLDKNRIKDAFTSCILKLKQYKDDPTTSNYLDKNTIKEYHDLVTRVNTIFENSIIRIQLFFKDSNQSNQNKGENDNNGLINEDQCKELLKSLKEIISLYNEQKQQKQEKDNQRELQVLKIQNLESIHLQKMQELEQNNQKQLNKELKQDDILLLRIKLEQQQEIKKLKEQQVFEKLEEEKILRGFEFKNIFDEGLVSTLPEKVSSFMKISASYLQIMKAQYEDNIKPMKQNQEASKIISEVTIQDCQQTMHAINNLLRADIILSNQHFNDCIEEMKKINQESYNSLKEKMSTLDLQKIQGELISCLEFLKSQSFGLEFIKPQRSDADSIKVYRQIQANYEILQSAYSTTAGKNLISRDFSSNISKIFKEFEENFEKMIRTQVELMALFLENIQKQESISQNLNQEEVKSSFIELDTQNTLTEIIEILQEKGEKIGQIFNGLQLISNNIIILRNQIQEVNKKFEDSINRILTKFKIVAKQCFAGEPQSIKLQELANILSQIQQMLENLLPFEDQIKKTLDKILEDYGKFRPKGIIDLQLVLNQQAGSHGNYLSENHSLFKGLNILKANEKFMSKGIIDVLELLEGTDLKKVEEVKRNPISPHENPFIDDGERTQLKQFYDEYLAVYKEILQEKCAEIKTQKNKNTPVDLKSIKSHIKNTLSNISQKTWQSRDIFGQIQFKPKNSQYIQDYNKLPILLANIFAMWTLMNSEHYKKAEEADPSQQNLDGYLLQPHVAQILSILRILGVGYPNQSNKGMEFNQNWQNVFGHPSDIRNNLVQIKTGEGKSVTLAVISIVLALHGFEVKCACYSKYLSERDYEAFAPLFRELGLLDQIIYGTFNEIAEIQINREGDVREILKHEVLQSYPKPEIKQEEEKQGRRPQVLLIDEVDVFFSESFYGQTYIPQTLIYHQYISALLDYIWNHRQERKRMSGDDLKSPYLSLRVLKKTDEYKNVLGLFKEKYAPLIEEVAKKMIYDVVEYESSQHKYVVVNGEIGYENQDQISTNIRVGYQTLFAYYYENSRKRISDDILQSKKAIGLNCACYSYAEVPLEYDIILGVTGTLETKEDSPQANIIKNVYQIHTNTLSPSVHSSQTTDIFNPALGVQIVYQNKEYYLKLINKMNSFKNLNKKRPIILFFENNQQLENFENSAEFKDQNWKYQILNETDDNRVKKMKVYKATNADMITLSTKIFGRGTDFCCFDERVLTQGGLVVIQLFLSENESEEIQIRGRTGRQGTKGTYEMFLNFQDLSKFNIDLEEIDKSPNKYQTLCDARDKRLKDKQEETTKNREDLRKNHLRSNNEIGNIKASRLDSDNFKSLLEFLNLLNKGPTLESNRKIMKVLALIDGTKSMGKTLDKTKNSLGNMFEGARKALKDNGLSEDLILMKIAGYRNYSSLKDKLLEVSPGWTSDQFTLRSFLNDKLKNDGGQGNEAIEIGLQYANNEILKDDDIPLSLIIIIGDAPPNTPENVESKRREAAREEGNMNYWLETEDYKVPTHWSTEIKKLEDSEISKVPVYSFYVLNEKVTRIEEAKAALHTEFSKLAVNGGKCSFLDIHNEQTGQKQLQDFMTSLIVYRAIQINLDEQKAKEAIKHFGVSFI